MKRLLIVDDEETIRFGLTRYFTRAGYRVDCAIELEEAEALSIHNCYDAVIADLSLTTGGSEGLEIVRSLRSLCPESVVVILTANGTPHVEREVLRCGAGAFLHKPQPLGYIAAVVAQLIAGDAP
jgi:DNA-binding response OmpR family regulator